MTTTEQTNSLQKLLDFLDELERLPDDATIDDILESVDVIHGITVGLAQSEQGLGIPHDEAMRRMRQWLK